MAGTFYVEVENDLRGCAILLKSVVCEWLLIFFILVNAVYLYFLKKFAKYCNLQLPCMLCSRLDHIFGNEKPDFYKDLICNDHRSKLSSLVYCHNHGSLADVHDVCEECLLSFATKRDSSPEIYKFLIGKLGLDGLRNPVSEMDFFHGFVSVKSCSCCKKQWRCRPNVQKLVKTHSFGARAPKPDNIPLPSMPRRDVVVKARVAAVAAPTLFSGFPDSNYVPRVGYIKPKISSDSESGFVFSEEDDGKLDHVDQQGPGYSLKKQFEDCFTTKKVISPTDMALDVPRQQTKQLRFNLAQPKLMPKLEAPRVSIQLPTSSKPSSDKNQDDNKADGDAETWEAFDLITPKSGQGDNEDKKDGITLTSLHPGFNQTSKASTLPPDQLVRNGISTRANMSTAQIQVSSSDDKSDIPFRFKVNGYAVEPFKDIETSQLNLSLSGFSVDNTEGDQYLITKLRKQIEEERECIERLREELEEERSASAEAANQAMAMITKLQEEKAVLNMDAQQYLRMMEEQAEHDMDALENANDLLTEKEKEIQDLEAELEFYRMKYPDEYEEEFAQAELISQGPGMVGGKSMGFEGFPAESS